MTTKFKEEVRKTVFVKAIRDTHITLMKDLDTEFEITEGTLMFHETSPNQTKYLEPDEIGLYLPKYKFMAFGYRPDWVSERTISDPN